LWSDARQRTADTSPQSRQRARPKTVAGQSASSVLSRPKAGPHISAGKRTSKVLVRFRTARARIFHRRIYLLGPSLNFVRDCDDGTRPVDTRVITCQAQLEVRE